MKVVLRKSRKQIERKFIDEPSDPHWAAFLSLNASVLPAKHKPVFEALMIDKDKVFFEFVNVPWYFDEVGSHVLDKKTECRLRVKVCCEFYFIQLSFPDGKLIGRPFFHRVGRETEGSAPSGSPDALRGLGDLLLFLSVTLSEATNAEQASELLDWFDLELKIEPSGGEIKVTPSVKWPLGTDWKIVGDPDKYFIKYSDKDKILVASPHVREAVAQIAEVWHNPSVTSVLLSAWTGSGKEPLKDLFMHGMQQSDPSLPPFSAPSLARQGRSAPEQIADALVKSKRMRSVG